MAIGHLKWDQEVLFEEKKEFKKCRKTVPFKNTKIVDSSHYDLCTFYAEMQI